MKEEDAYQGPPAPHGYHLVGWKGLHPTSCQHHPGGAVQANLAAKRVLEERGYDFVKIHRVIRNTTGDYTGECLYIVKKPA